MSASLDTLTSIKVCQQVVDSGSFMRAAERLDMATAAVSDHPRAWNERATLQLAARIEAAPFTRGHCE